MRTLIVGDVHGCPDELEILLERVKFDTGDRLILVGDVLARGPDSIGVLDIVRRTGAVLVRGNHEEKILRSRDSEAHPMGWTDPKEPSKKDVKPLGRIHADVVTRLRPVDWTLLEASPLWVDLPEHNARVVHAGVVPGIPIEKQKRSTLMTIRCLGSRGEPLEKGGHVLWGERYREAPHIVFGHYARVEPQLHPWATGLDTGCVYGGHLTGLLLENGEPVPMDADVRRKRLVVVDALREYYEAR